MTRPRPGAKKMMRRRSTADWTMVLMATFCYTRGQDRRKSLRFFFLPAQTNEPKNSDVAFPALTWA